MVTGAFSSYARLLAELHAQIAAGAGESADADAIRDQMDDLWARLPDGEQQLSRWLSEDIYLLSSVWEASQDGSPEAAKALHAARDAMEAQDWPAFLALCRKIRTQVEPSRLFYLCGRAWNEMGEKDIALLFLEKACASDPTNETYQYLALSVLAQSHRVTEAQRRVEEILSDYQQYPAKIVVKAADLVYAWGSSLPGEKFAAICRELIPVLKSAAGTLQRSSAAPALVVSALVLQGLCCEAAGEKQLALVAFDSALAIDPDNEAALVARGTLGYGERSDAVEDLRKACRQDARLAWPYFLLAHHALFEKDYEGCQALCEKSLQRHPSPGMVANILEWKAISKFSLGAQQSDVSLLFNQAVSLAPENQRLRENFAKLSTFKAVGQPQLVWNLEQPNDLRQLNMPEPSRLSAA